MPRIDQYINAFVRFGAQGAVMASDEKVTLRFPQGNRFASQSTPHTQLVELVREILPRGVDLQEPGRATFAYALDGKEFDVRVEAVAGAWAVHIVPRSAPKKDDEGGRKSRSRTFRPSSPPPAAALGRIKPTTVAVPTPQAPASTDEPAVVRGRAPTPASASSVASSPIDKLLVRMVELGASDLHLTTGQPPMIRLQGDMAKIPYAEPLDGDLLERWLADLAPSDNRREFDERNDTDFGYTIEGVSRFRANLFRDRVGPAAVFRAIPFEIVPADRLGLPPRALEMCALPKGLVVVTGPTGSGKSTTLASLVDHINRTRADHIITIEDPIEFVHESKRCLVNQREVHKHTRSFKDALRAALREDPDIVLVGEMRDLETIEIAVETAETGHLVFGTLHTTTAPSTVDRIIDQFPTDRQEQIRQMLSESMRGVIAQTLCRKVGGGRVAAFEILVGSPAVANLIRERKTFQLFSVMQTGKNQGMLTLNDSLLDLVRRGVVEPREALSKAANRSELRGMLQRENMAAGLGE